MYEFWSKFHKFVSKGLINYISALVQIMTWRRPGDKPLSEPMMVSLESHICVTLPQWVKCICLNENYCLMIYSSMKFVSNCSIDNNSTLVQIMAWHWTGGKPLTGQMVTSINFHDCVIFPQFVNTQRLDHYQTHIWPFNLPLNMTPNPQYLQGGVIFPHIYIFFDN